MQAISYRRVSYAFSATLCLAGCAQVPSLDSPLDIPVTGPSSIYVVDVTRRVKCELYYALKDHLPDSDPPAKRVGALPIFHTNDQRYWLSKWDVTVHLELLLNDQGGISPGVTFSQLLPNAYNLGGGPSSFPIGKPAATFAPTASAIPQTFSIGLGGGIGVQAVRTDDVQFTISVAELVNEFKYHADESHPYYGDCTKQGLGDTAFLHSNLGLREWIDSALGPTFCYDYPNGTEPSLPHQCETDDDFRYLRIGRHPQVSSGVATKPVPPVARPIAMLAVTAQLNPTDNDKEKYEAAKTLYLAELATLKTAVDASIVNSQIIARAKRLTFADKTICPALQDFDFPKYETDTKDLSALYENAKKEGDTVFETAPENDYQSAAKNLRIAEADMLQFDGKDKTETIVTRLNEARQAFQSDVQTCPSLVRAKPVAANPDPPLDNIIHTVQFLVASNASVTPSWNLVRFKSSTSSSLAALTHNNTQTLSIVLGPIAPKNGNNQALVNNQSLKSSLQGASFTP